MKKRKKKQKNKFHKIVDKITHGYEHRHPLIFFTVVFNIFVITTIFTINAINDDMDLLGAKKILFGQPNPKIQADIEELTEGYPIVEMAPLIAKENREVAAFMIAIAKKESAWGKRTPKLNGEECYNYWGFRKKRKRMGSGGHTCFDSPEDAVRTVAKRIDKLVKKGYDTPREMVLWKCGDCTGPARVGAGKWIRDVDLYYQKMMDTEQSL